MIKKECSGWTPREIEGFTWIAFVPSMVETFFTETNEPMYPNMQSEEGREAFVQAFAQAVRAVKSGNYEEVPEYDPNNGERNFDLICEVCGNLVDSKCKLSENNEPLLPS